MLQLSLVHAKSGRPQLQYKIGKGSKQTIRLGMCTETIALVVKAQVRELLLAKIFNRSIPPDTEVWLQGLDDSIHLKFAKHELVIPRVVKTEKPKEIWTVKRLGDYCVSLWFKPGSSTEASYKQSIVNLTTYFSLRCHLCDSLSEITDSCGHCGKTAPEGTADTTWPIAEINEGCVDEYVDWMFTSAKKNGEGYKASSANKRISHARRIFKQACRLKLIDENPFEHIQASPDDGEDRSFHVTEAIVKSIMKNETDPHFRLVIALARYGGLRIPSEIAPLKRSWVGEEYLKVHTVKLNRLPQRRWRHVPIFPPLRPYIEAVMKLDGQPDDPLFPRHKFNRSTTTYRLKKILGQANLKPWSKLWINMRSTRITELEDSKLFSEAALDAWFGNTKKIRQKHYNQVFKDQLTTALAWETASMCCSGCG